MLRDLVAKGEVRRERMRRPGEDDGAAEERSGVDSMLVRRDRGRTRRPRLGARGGEARDSCVHLVFVSTRRQRVGHAKPG